MKRLQLTHKKIIAYFLVALLVFHLFSGSISPNGVRAEGDSAATYTVSLESNVEVKDTQTLPKQAVEVTYSIAAMPDGVTSLPEDVVAYRKVVKQKEDGEEVIAEGTILLQENTETSSYSVTERFDGKAEENGDGVWKVEDGTYVLTYYLADGSTNQPLSNEETLEFVMDATAPDNVLLKCVDEDGVDDEKIECTVMVEDTDFENCDVVVLVQRKMVDGSTVYSQLCNAIPEGDAITENVETLELENGVEKAIAFTEDGKYEVYMKVTDVAGNVCETEKISFVVDKTVPDVVITGQRADGTDVDADGIYSTGAGNITLCLQVADFYLQEESLAVSVEKDAEDVTETFSYQWSAQDEIYKAELTFDDQIEDGVYTVSVRAQDGYHRSEEKEFCFEIDNTAATIQDLKVSYSSPNGNSPVDDGILFFLNGSAKVSARVYEKNWKGAKIGIKTQKDYGTVTDENIAMNQREEKVTTDSYSEEGKYVTSIYGEDAYGNKSEEQSISYVIDKTKPVLSIRQVVDWQESDISENQLFSVGENRVLRFTVNEKYHDQSSYTIQVVRKTETSVQLYTTTLTGDSIPWSGSGEYLYYDSADLFREEGQYTVTLSGKDMAGNKAESKTVTFYIDSTAPVIEQSSAVKNGGIYNENVKFQYTIEEFNYKKGVDAQIVVERTLDGVCSTKTTTLDVDKTRTAFSYLCSEQGAYKITVTAKDAAGNEAKDSAGQVGYTIEFIIDKEAPQVGITGVTNGKVTRDPVTVTFTSKDRNHDFNAYKISVTRSDVDGELESYTLTGTQLSSLDMTQGWNTDGSEMVGQNLYSTERTLQFSKEGIYTISFSGTDKAGNVSKRATIQFSVDKTAPVISEVTYSDADGILTERFHSIYSNKAILVEFAVTDKVTGVNPSKVYVTVGDVSKRSHDTKLYVAHKSIGNYYYVYIPTDIGVKEFDDTITIWANDVLSNESSFVSSNIVYRTAKPGITMTCDVDYTKWTNQDVTFQTTATDEIAGLKEIVYKVNGKVVKKTTFKKLTYTYDYDVVASEDADKVTGYAVSVEVTSNSGAKQTIKRQVYIDKTKPKVRLSGVEKGAHYRTNQTIQTSVEDVSYKNTKTVYYITRTLDGKSSTMSSTSFKAKEYTDSCTRKMTKEGQYTIYAITTDSAGNKTKSNTLSFVIDKTAPKVEVSGVAEGSMSGSSVTAQFDCEESFFATNDVKIEVERELDGQKTVREVTNFPKNAKKTSMKQTFSEDGTYRVIISAVDKAGNVAASQSLTFSVDATKPEIRIAGTENYQLWSTPPTVQFVVEESYYSENQVKITGTRRDAEGNLETLQLPEMHNSGKTSSLSQMFSEDGVYAFEIVSRDKAGNESRESIHFTIDQTKPQIQNVTKYDGGYYQLFRLTHSLNDMIKDLTVVSYRILLNGVDYNGTDTITQEGKYNLFIEVKDELGHVNTQNIEFIVDRTPPKVIFAGVEDGAIVKEEGKVSFALFHAEDTITGIRMNGVEYGTDVRELTYSEYGVYQIEVDCEDKAGNSVTKSLRFVYSNPKTITYVAVGTGAVAMIAGVWLWIRIRKRKEEKIGL